VNYLVYFRHSWSLCSVVLFVWATVADRIPIPPTDAETDYKDGPVPCSAEERRCSTQGLAHRDWVGQRGSSMDAVPLNGRWVRLVPLDESHREPLRQAAADDRIWELTLTRASGPGFDPWFDEALAEMRAGRRLPFAVGRAADGRWVGSTSYLDLAPRHRRVEVGSTWYQPDAWGTAVNPECKLLLLGYAFDVVGVNRVALVTDELNARSQTAIAKLGAVREGVLRSHMVSQGGRVRDSVMFSIVAAEWPAVRAGLVARLPGYEAEPTATS
jgi:RimJ/RimL family protein N-acetyltransferase